MKSHTSMKPPPAHLIIALGCSVQQLDGALLVLPGQVGVDEGLDHVKLVNQLRLGRGQLVCTAEQVNKRATLRRS